MYIIAIIMYRRISYETVYIITIKKKEIFFTWSVNFDVQYMYINGF